MDAEEKQVGHHRRKTAQEQRTSKGIHIVTSSLVTRLEEKSGQQVQDVKVEEERWGGEGMNQQEQKDQVPRRTPRNEQGPSGELASRASGRPEKGGQTPAGMAGLNRPRLPGPHARTRASVDSANIAEP